MLLQKKNITVDVIHPTDIARYKRLGYKEVKPEEFAAQQQEIVEAAVGTGSQPAEAEAAAEEAPRKGKAKK